MYSRDDNILLFTCNTDSLEDVHLLDLSKRITTGEELTDLGIKVLKLPDFRIRAALYDHKKSIQAATQDVIHSWLLQQSNRQEAYTALHTGLKEAKMHQLAGELQLWVKGTVVKPSAGMLYGKRFYKSKCLPF